MNSISRKEIKYILPYTKALTLQKKLDPIMERDTHGCCGNYFIRSQYYDSLYDHDWFDNLSGMFQKRKIRLRIYSLDAENVTLEYKCKNGTNGNKYSIEISREEALQIEQGNVSSLLHGGNPLAFQLYHQMTEYVYRPKAIVDYHRLAFVYPAGRVRITFDTEIRCANVPYGLFSQQNTIPISDRKQILMEVKYTGFLPEEIRWILQGIDQLPESNSKYSLARMSLYACS